MFALNLSAQQDYIHRKIYKVRPKYDLPGAAGAVVLSTIGFHALDKKATLSAEKCNEIESH